MNFFFQLSHLNTNFFLSGVFILIISERYPFIDSWLSVEDYLGKAGVSSLI